MFNKKITLIFIFLLTLFTLSAVSAADNRTGDAIGLEELDELAGIENTQTIKATDNDVLNDDDLTFSNLQEKIDASDANSTVTLDNDYKYNDGFDKNGISITKDLTIDGQGHTIDGDGQTRIFNIENCNVIFKNIIFINAHSDGDGGAIRGSSQSVNCTFKENYANGNGGAIFGGNAINCTFTGNCAEYYGGAISQGDATGCNFTDNNYAGKNGGAIHCGKAEDCIFTDNHASNDDEGNGGALFNASAVRCIFTSNSAKHHGGAIFSGDAIDCTFNENNAWLGGAVYDCNVLNCIFTGNYAYCGGAIYNGNASNSTFNNNRADEDEGEGGAIYNGSADNCVFIGNSAYHGGAMHTGEADGCYANYCNFTGNSADGGGALYSITALGCIFTNNTSTYNGGAIHFGNAVNCTFTGNIADKEKGSGGAIYNGSADNCVFIGNSAYHGGAMHTGEADGCYANHCNFTGNSADGGGAIYSIVATGCIFTNNTSTCDGGAMYYSTAAHCTFNLNHADRDGGAIYRGYAEHSVFTNNSANSTGGAICGDNLEVYDVTCLNCTFISNRANNGQAVSNADIKLCIFEDNDYSDSVIDVVRISVEYGELGLKQGEYLNLSLSDCDGYDLSMKIYKEGTLIGTYNVKSGSSFLVNLTNGVYNFIITTVENYEGVDEFDDYITVNASLLVSLNSEFLKMYGDNDKFVLEYTDNLGCPVKNLTVLVNVGKINVNYVTDEDGRIEVNFTDIIPGSYNANFIVHNNDDYDDSIVTRPIVIEKALVKLTASKLITYYNSDDEFIITLIDRFNNPIDNVTLSVDLNGTENYTTDKNGQIRISTLGLIPNAYLVNITFGGDEINCEISITSQLIINKDVCELIATKFITGYNSSDEFIITLCDLNGNPIVDGLIIVNLEGSKKYTTDENGQIKVSTQGLKPAEYVANITFEGNDMYEKSNISADVIVEKISTKLIADALTKDYVFPRGYVVVLKDEDGNPAGNVSVALEVNGTKELTTDEDGQIKFYIYEDEKLVIALSDESGNPMSGAVLQVGLNGDENYTTDENGQIQISTKDLIPGTYLFNVSYAGDEIYQNSNSTAKIIINKCITTLTANSVTTTYTVNKNLVITLKDSQGIPISGAVVSVDLGGVKKYTTDIKGQIVIPIKYLVPNKYTAKITFSGDNYCLGSQVNTLVVVKKVIPKITASSKKFKRSLLVKKYTVTLKNNLNKVMKYKKVKLKIKGKVYKAITNSKGKATFYIINFTKKGTFKATITYAGSKYYKKVTKKVKIKTV